MGVIRGPYPLHGHIRLRRGLICGFGQLADFRGEVRNHALCFLQVAPEIMQILLFAPPILCMPGD
jgi:hypothetical protein